MNAVQQFLEMVAMEYQRIEELKAEAAERGEILEHITVAYLNGEISAEDFHDLIARTCRKK